MNRVVKKRRGAVASKFISEALDLEREGKHKPAAIRFENAVPLIDDTEEKAFILYSAFVCYKLALDHAKACQIITRAAKKYRDIGQNEAADTCEFERDRMLNEPEKPALRIRKGVQAALRDCFSDIHPCNIL